MRFSQTLLDQRPYLHMPDQFYHIKRFINCGSKKLQLFFSVNHSDFYHSDWIHSDFYRIGTALGNES